MRQSATNDDQQLSQRTRQEYAGGSDKRDAQESGASAHSERRDTTPTRDSSLSGAISRARSDATGACRDAIQAGRQATPSQFATSCTLTRQHMVSCVRRGRLSLLHDGVVPRGVRVVQP